MTNSENYSGAVGDSMTDEPSRASDDAGLVERLLRTETGPNGEPVNIDGKQAAAAILSLTARNKALEELVHESLFHLRLDEAAKAYHERAEAALNHQDNRQKEGE